jgi:N-methylhydantoinase A/oxoprolinase/acetone carboxylase beta subunit
MSWRIAADIREMYVELVATNGELTFFSRHPNRKDQLFSGFNEGIQQITGQANAQASLERKLARLAVRTDLERVSLREHWGNPVALFVTEGFEHLLEIGTQQRNSLFGLTALRSTPLVSRDSIFGVTERTKSDGTIEVELDNSEVEFVISKLAMTEIKSVAVCLIHSDLNPKHENQVAEKLREKGYAVTCSHEFTGDERVRASKAVSKAFVHASYESLLEEFAEAGFEKQNITFIQNPAGILQDGIHLCLLEDRLRLSIFSQGKLSLEEELATSPMSTISIDEGGLVHVGPDPIETEPGPVSFGKGLKLCLLDATALASQIGSEENRLRWDLGRVAKQIAPIAKQLRLSPEVCAAKFAELGATQIVCELSVAMKKVGISCETGPLFLSGWLAPILGPKVSSLSGFKKSQLAPHHSWQPAWQLLGTLPTGNISEKGVIRANEL